jgi:hypothetical protein
MDILRDQYEITRKYQLGELFTGLLRDIIDSLDLSKANIERIVEGFEIPILRIDRDFFNLPEEGIVTKNKIEGQFSVLILFIAAFEILQKELSENQLVAPDKLKLSKDCIFSPTDFIELFNGQEVNSEKLRENINQYYGKLPENERDFLIKEINSFLKDRGAELANHFLPQVRERGLDKAFNQIYAESTHIFSNHELPDPRMIYQFLEMANQQSLLSGLGQKLFAKTASLPNTDKEDLYKFSRNFNVKPIAQGGRGSNYLEDTQGGSHWTRLELYLNFLDYLNIPNGDYEGDFYHHLGNTAKVLTHLIKQNAKGQCQEVVDKNRELIRLTARFADSSANGNPAPLATIYEGVISIAQAAYMLTARRLDGYDNPNDLLGNIIHNGHLKTLARVVPVGIIGPATLAFKRFSIDPLIVDDQHRLKFNPELVKRFKETHPNSPSNYSNMRSCPVAHGKNSGVQALAEVFLTIFQSLDQI